MAAGSSTNSAALRVRLTHRWKQAGSNRQYRVRRPRFRETGSCRLCLPQRRRQCDETGYHDDGGGLPRDRWFESGFLQRGVRCQLDTAVRRSTSGVIAQGRTSSGQVAVLDGADWVNCRDDRLVSQRAALRRNEKKNRSCQILVIPGRNSAAFIRPLGNQAVSFGEPYPALRTLAELPPLGRADDAPIQAQHETGDASQIEILMDHRSPSRCLLPTASRYAHGATAWHVLASEAQAGLKPAC